MRFWVEVSFSVPGVWEEVIADILKDMGFSGLWIEDNGKTSHWSFLKAYIPEKDWHPALKERLATDLERLSAIFAQGAEKGTFAVRKIEEEDWASKWLPFFEPIRVGPVWIRPGEKAVQLAEGESEIIVDPGQAFGTGHHETTRLCMEALLDVAKSVGKNTPLLDLGTGSGILAMFAARLGFKNILGLDIDKTATDTARKNVTLNDLSGDSETESAGSIQIAETPIGAVTRRFSIVLANLTTRDLLCICRILSKRVATHGMLIVSGILLTEAQEVIGAFIQQGMALLKRYRENEWACLVFQKHGVDDAADH
jgi:ribosomal protein L11 methyltransferase